MKKFNYRGIKVVYNEGADYSKEEIIEFLDEVHSDYADVFQGAKDIDFTHDEYFTIGNVKYEYVGGRLYKL